MVYTPSMERRQPRLADAPFAITPNDGANLAQIAYGIYVGASGTVKVDTPSSTGITFQGIAGTQLPVIATKVYATGTSATGLVGGNI